jgi:two-component system sensor histidine kinase CreC
MSLPLKINISLKIFLGYFVLVGLAAWFVLTIFVDEVKPGVRQAMEDSLVDTASILAALASAEVKHGNIQQGQFASSLQQYQHHAQQASIWGVKKQSADYRVYIANRQGIVIFDSANVAVGQDYSRWNDVYLTLRGRYGVRSSPEVAGDTHKDTIMYVAAPIKDGDTIIGSLTVAKPNRTLLPFIERAQHKIIRWGALLLTLSILIGALFTWRFTRKIQKLREYALLVSKGEKATPPTSSNDELAELALAMQTMRNELDGKQYVQDSVQHLTHELKSPLTAIQGAAELISPSMSPETQQQFLKQIKAQASRLETIIQNMLGLAALEHQQQLSHLTKVNLSDLINTQITHLAEKAKQHKVEINHSSGTAPALMAEVFLLGQAIYNVLDNAIDFSPPDSKINIHVALQNQHAEIQICDQGTGIPDYALSKIFDKFYSLPRPHNGHKSTGLGLNFVQEVIKLHHGHFRLQNNPDVGVTAIISLPI